MDVEKYKLRRMKTKVKTSTINKEIRTLKAILNKGVEWELIPNNRIAKMKYSNELDSKPPRFYTKEELHSIYCYAPYNWHWWQLMTNTGLRRKEARQLKWEHVNENSIIIMSTTKERSKSGKWREVPLNNQAKLALKRFERDRKGEYIFPRTNIGSISRAFMNVLERAPISEHKGSLHCLRHTFCSHLVIAGVPLRTVQKLAGHASFTTTERYSHLTKDHLIEAVNLLDDDKDEDI